jgi:hypothetical protein
MESDKPPTDQEISNVLHGLPGLPSTFGNTFSYSKNEGHEERDGFGVTFNAGKSMASVGVEIQDAAPKPGCWGHFYDFLMLGPKVVNEPTYTPVMKKVVLALISVTGILGPLTGAIYSPALPAVKEDFQTTTEWVNATLTAGIIALWVSLRF